MRRKFAERLFYWIGRRLGWLPVSTTEPTALNAECQYLMHGTVKVEGFTYGVAVIVTHFEGRELVHALSHRLLTRLHHRTPKTIGQCKRRP